MRFTRSTYLVYGRGAGRGVTVTIARNNDYYYGALPVFRCNGSCDSFACSGAELACEIPGILCAPDNKLFKFAIKHVKWGSSRNQKQK